MTSRPRSQAARGGARVNSDDVRHVPAASDWRLMSHRRGDLAATPDRGPTRDGMRVVVRMPLAYSRVAAASPSLAAELRTVPCTRRRP